MNCISLLYFFSLESGCKPQPGSIQKLWKTQGVNLDLTELNILG